MDQKGQEILREMNVKEKWLNNNVLSGKLQYFGHITQHDSLEKTIMEVMMPGQWEKGRPRGRWMQDIKDHLNMPLTETWSLVQDRLAFWRAVNNCYLPVQDMQLDDDEHNLSKLEEEEVL